MFKIKNNLDQPIAIDGKTLPADGTMTIGTAAEADAKRLEARGYVSFVEPPKKEVDLIGPPVVEPPKTEGGKTK